MARTHKRRSDVQNPNRRGHSTRVLRRSPVDFDKLSKAFVGLAMARIERDAEQEHKQQDADQKGASHEASA